MKIYEITDPCFREYGRVVDQVDLSSLVQAMKDTPVPEGVIYEPSIAELEALPAYEALSNTVYGEMPIQIGYCNGHNVMLNALEYHRDSEINVAATDAVLMLGLKKDVAPDHTLDTATIKAFLVPAGTAVEVYATTLHYAPCDVDHKGFQVAIVLPRGTNYDLKTKHDAGGEDALLTATNKWLIGHAQGGLDAGAFIGLKGKNLNLNE